MKRLSPTLIGGLVGAGYFLSTIMVAVFASGGEIKAVAVISQLLNLHVTYLLAVLVNVLPLHLVADWMFQFLLGLTVNFILGGFMAKLVMRMRRKRHK